MEHKFYQNPIEFLTTREYLKTSYRANEYMSAYSMFIYIPEQVNPADLDYKMVWRRSLDLKLIYLMRAMRKDSLLVDAKNISNVDQSFLKSIILALQALMTNEYDSENYRLSHLHALAVELRRCSKEIREDWLAKEIAAFQKDFARLRIMLDEQNYKSQGDTI